MLCVACCQIFSKASDSCCCCSDSKTSVRPVGETHDMDSTKITVTNMRIIVEDQKEDSPGADGMWHVLGLLQAVCGVLLRGLLRHQDDPEPGAGARVRCASAQGAQPLAAQRRRGAIKNFVFHFYTEEANKNCCAESCCCCFVDCCNSCCSWCSCCLPTPHMTGEFVKIKLTTNVPVKDSETAKKKVTTWHNLSDMEVDGVMESTQVANELHVALREYMADPIGDPARITHSTSLTQHHSTSHTSLVTAPVTPALSQHQSQPGPIPLLHVRVNALLFALIIHNTPSSHPLANSHTYYAVHTRTPHWPSKPDL